GRAGAKGTSISFAGEDDAFQLPPIEELLGGKLECVPPEEELLKPVPKRHRSAEEKAANDAMEAEQAAAAAANRKRSGDRRDGRRPGRGPRVGRSADGAAQVRYTPGRRPARGSHPRERRTPGSVEHQLDEIAPGNSADEPVLDVPRGTTFPGVASPGGN